MPFKTVKPHPVFWSIFAHSVKTCWQLLVNTLLLPLRTVKGLLALRRFWQTVRLQCQIWGQKLGSELSRHLPIGPWLQESGFSRNLPAMQGPWVRWGLFGLTVLGLGMVWAKQYYGADVATFQTSDMSSPTSLLAVLDDTAPTALDDPTVKPLLWPMVPRPVNPLLFPELAQQPPALPEATMPEAAMVTSESTVMPTTQQPTAMVSALEAPQTVTGAKTSHVVIRQQATAGKPAKVTDIQVDQGQTVVVVINNYN